MQNYLEWMFQWFKLVVTGILVLVGIVVAVIAAGIVFAVGVTLIKFGYTLGMVFL